MASPLRPRVLYGRRRIASRIRTLAAEIDAHYAHRAVTLCGILNGGVVFATDLARALRNDRVEMSFLRAASYGAQRRSSGRVRLDLLDEGGIAGREVLIVEDILETGRTLRTVIEALTVCGATDVRTVVLLQKPGRLVEDVHPHWVGFRMKEDVFVAGYGLDAGNRWRHLPDIIVPPPEVRR
jgi:hypoxanthine phosphoribosyltransferase